MKNIIIAVIIGFLLGGTVTAIAYNKYEGGDNEAQSSVGYGRILGGGIVPLKVDANGVLQIR